MPKIYKGHLKEYEYQGTGLGIPSKLPPISTKFPPYIYDVLRSLPDRSQYIRDAVIAKLREDGLLP